MKLEARISAIIADEKLKAYASVCIDDAFLIKGIKVVDGIHGRFVAMPSRKTRTGEFKDVCFSFRNQLIYFLFPFSYLHSFIDLLSKPVRIVKPGIAYAIIHEYRLS